LVTTTTANDAWFCVGNVFVTKFVANFAIVWGNMFRDVRCFVEQELARGASFAGCGRGVTGVLELAGVANGTECGAIDVFTAKGTKFAIVWRVVLRDVGCLVEKELTGWTRFTGCGRGVAAVLKLAGVANGTDCLVDVLTTKGTKVAGNVFGVESAVVDDKLSSLAKIACNVKIQMGLVLIVTGWTNLTLEILVVDANSPGRTGFAVGVAGACVGGSDGAGRAIELSC
jgi:hypothetical protein